MSCQGTQTSAFDAAFARFWPEHQPFPPATPWLAAAVGRAEAKQWAVAVGADRDPGVLSWNMQAMLHVVGLAMAGGGGYAEARKEKKKKKKDPPELPIGTGNLCCETGQVACCAGKTSCYYSCTPNADGTCTISCMASGGGLEAADHEGFGP